MTPAACKAAFAPYAAALASGPDRAACDALLRDDAVIRLCHPFGDGTGRDHLWSALGSLAAALPDLERRDMIRVAGCTPEGELWLGCMGSYMGTFTGSFLDIPPTGHLVHMRYHEFFRFDGARTTEMQAIWDLPELMMQARAWPMAPQLGAFLNTPAPMTGDGLTEGGDGRAALDHVHAMLTDLCKYPADPDPAVMNLARYWHPSVNWYGPCGIGTTRGIAGFRAWHQAPFLRAMPDRRLDAMGNLMSHWISEGEYVAETGWPNMRLSITGDGWMGIAPTGTEVTMRSLDFWRLEDGLIRENWVLVDLLDVYHQLGVDVLARLREFGRARVPGTVPTPDWRAA